MLATVYLHVKIILILQCCGLCCHRLVDTDGNGRTSNMLSWRTKMMLFHAEGKIQTNEISIKRGIFQGDSLSPLLFYMTLAKYGRFEVFTRDEERYWNGIQFRWVCRSTVQRWQVNQKL